MIQERMLELLVLNLILKDISGETIKFKDKTYNTRAIAKRTSDILEEFLESYVIESDSKE